MKLKYVIATCGICFSCTLSSFALVSCVGDETVEQPGQNPEEPEDTVDPKFQETCRIIMERIKAKMMTTDVQKANENAAKWMAGISESGTWSDIDYTDTSLSFKPEQHIDRLKQLAQAYVLEGCDYFGSPEVSQAVANGLKFWIELAPKAYNWWNNQISVPQKIGEILILMRYGAEPVPEELENSIIDYLIKTGGNPAEQTGANKTDVALHWLYRGLLRENPNEVDAAVYHTFMPLSYVEPREEGIQYDNGYFQHGPQTYIGGYAPVMINGVLRVAQYTKDTDYKITPSQMSVFRNFITQAYAPSFRGDIQFFNLVGRSVSRPGSLKNEGIVGNVLEPMKAIDPDHAGEYDEYISYFNNNDYSGVQDRFTNYYIGDWALYFGNKYSASVRLTSTRTRKIEHGNNENLRCFFMSDGSMDLAVKGGEYFNIFPAWDWSHVPGVTCPEMGNDVPLPDGWGEAGEGTFSGGLSAGKDGFCGFKMLITKHNVDVSGYKSYFFMDDAIICLGSGIKSKMAKAINTTLDQCLLNGNVTYSMDGSEFTVSNGQNVADSGIDWLWHNDRGYFFPEKQKVSLKLGERSGSWKDINTNKTGSVKVGVCTLWLNHGLLPKNATYSYVIVPGIGKDEMKNYDVANFKIVANRPEVQSIQSVSGKKIQAMFYAADTIEADGLKITVDQPCAVMLQETGADTYNLYFSDPAHKLSRLTVTVEKNNKKVQYTFNQFAADNVYKGKTHQAVLTLLD